VVDFELFRPDLDVALGRSDRARGGRPPCDAVMMFRVLLLQTLYTLSDDQTEYQLRDRLSFMRFADLSLSDAVPDAKTIWLFRERLVRAGAFERLFARFDAALTERGYLAMGGQIVDVEPLERHWSERQWRGIVEARRPCLTQAEKGVVKDGGVPEDWKPARTRQVDRDGRWTLKRGKKKPVPPGGSARVSGEIAVPLFGYKNHVGIDREHGFVRRFKVTDAAAHDGAQLGAVLDPGNTASAVWADTAYHSAANIEMLEKRGLKPQFQRPKPRGKPMPRHVARGNARRTRFRSRVEHVFAAQKCRFALVIRTVGQARATAKLALANLAYNFNRFLWLEIRQAA
jgi:IS5 family transposase